MKCIPFLHNITFVADLMFDTKCFAFVFSFSTPRAHLHVVGILRFKFLTKTNRACPFLFILFLCLFLSLWPFQLYFNP